MEVSASKKISGDKETASCLRADKTILLETVDLLLFASFFHGLLRYNLQTYKAFMKRISQTRKNKLFWTITGCLFFSPVIVNITMQIMGFPFMVPELFVFPLLFIYRKQIGDFSDKRLLFISVIILLFLLAISLMIQRFSLIAIFATARGYLYLFLAFAYFRNRRIWNLEWILWLSIGSITGWLLIALYNFHLNRIIEADKLITPGNMLAVVFAISMVVLWQKRKLTYPTITLISVLCVFAGMRRLIVISLLACCLIFILAFFNSKKEFFMSSFVMLVTMFLIMSVYPSVENFLAENSPILYRRLIIKTEMTLSGENKSDEGRYNRISDFFNRTQNDIFPKGFVTKRSSESGLYIDVPILELSYTFGLPVFAIMMVLFIFRIIHHFRKYLLYKVRESAFCVVAAIVMIVLLFIEGTFLNYPFTTPFTGYALARIFSNTNLMS
jgi:hypothetical protein